AGGRPSPALPARPPSADHDGPGRGLGAGAAHAAREPAGRAGQAHDRAGGGLRAGHYRGGRPVPPAARGRSRTAGCCGPGVAGRHLTGDGLHPSRRCEVTALLTGGHRPGDHRPDGSHAATTPATTPAAGEPSGSLGLEVVRSAAAAMPAISLEEVTAAADLHTRTDRKYLVPAEDFRHLIGSLGRGLAVLEIDGGRTFGYESAYFDTPGLRAYHDHAHGRRRRFKVRTRSYLDSGLCALEVKTEGGRGETVKERTGYEFEDRYRLTPAARDLAAAQIGSVATAGALPLALVTGYSRTTIVDLAGQSRMPCDVDLTFSDPDRAGAGPRSAVLVESKTAGAASRVDRMLWRMGHRPIALSKYCAGLAVLYPHLPANRWSRVLR